jgi:formate dehydrogenase iron-sulfur subunit
LPEITAERAKPESAMSKAILYDATRCIGCKLCEQACAERWGHRYDETVAAQEKLSAEKLTAVLSREDGFMRRLCMHCADPTCASVCPVGAFTKTAAGPVVYDESKCIGCRYCMLACPFGVPRYEWDKTLPRVRKCDMCADRLAAGGVTACSEICPTGATITGEREELLAEARRRIRENPEQYIPHIYGEQEVGGTSVLLLSGVPFEQFGYRTDLLHEPMPMLTWRVLSRVPDLVLLGSVLLGGIWWITHRREEVAAAEARKTSPTAENG